MHAAVRIIVGFVAFALLLAVPTRAWQTTYFPPPANQGGWRSLVSPDAVPTPAQKRQVRRKAQMDTDGLLAAKDLVLPHGGSFLVIRRGWIVSEWGPTQSTAHVASIAKSLTAIAFMRLLDMNEGGAFGPRIWLADYAAAYLPAVWLQNDPNKAGVRLKHLLTMSSGLSFHDTPRPTSSYLQTVLSVPMANQPGKVWTYSSQPVDLLSLVVSGVTGSELKQFFDAEVGSRIGMTSFGWSQMGTYTVASAYAYLSPRELARPAYLLLNGGEWNGQQVLTRKRTELLTDHPQVLKGIAFGQPNSAFVAHENAPAYYGHLVWTNRKGLSLRGRGIPDDAFYMAGHGTCFVVGIPSEELLIVRLGPGPDPFEHRLLSWTTEAVVDAIVRRPETNGLERLEPGAGVRPR